MVAGVHNKVSISNALLFIFWPKNCPNHLPLVVESNIIAGVVLGGFIFGHIQPGPDSENFRWRGEHKVGISNAILIIFMTNEFP